MSDSISNPEPVVDAPAPQDGQAVGSPQPVEDGSQTSEQKPVEGSTPPVENAEAKELRRKVTALSEQLAGANDLFSMLKADPDLWSKVEAKVLGTQPQVDELAEVDKFFGEKLSEESAAVMQQAIRLLIPTLEKKLEKKFAPVLRETAQTAYASRQTNGLRKAGLDPNISENPEFQEHAKEFQADNPWIESVKRDDPVSAWKLIGESYKAKTGSKQSIQSQQDHLEDVRAASTLEYRGGKAAPANVAANSLTLRRGPNTARAMFEQIKRGISPDSIRLQ